jgi:hypothetical protein
MYDVFLNLINFSSKGPAKTVLPIRHDYFLLKNNELRVRIPKFVLFGT